MADPRLIPDHVPEGWRAAVPPPTTCVCAVPVPTVLAERKGAARTVCGHCGLPIRLGSVFPR